MSWQLWVLIAVAVAGVIVVLAVKLHHAQDVFDRIVDESRSDDLARRRRRQLRPALVVPAAHPQHRSRGRH